MTVLACVPIHPEGNGLGLRHRCAEDLGGRPVLAHVVERASRVAGVERVCLIAPAAERERLLALLPPGAAEYLAWDAPDLPQRGHLRARRKWAFHGWQGGIGGGFDFDEEGDPRALLAALDRFPADLVLVVSPAAPLLDVALTGRVLANLGPSLQPVNCSFAAAPPGLSGVAFRRPLLQGIAEAAMTLGESMERARQEAGPLLEVALQNESVTVPTLLASCPWRFTTDSDAQLSQVRELVAAIGPEADAAALVRGLAERPALQWGRHARDLEIELSADATVRCRYCALGSAAGRMDRALAERLLAQAAEHDDVRVTLGGRGDPLLHPDILALVRSSRAFALNIQTQATALDEACARGLIDAPVDVVSVCLDAVSGPAWSAIKQPDVYDLVARQLEQFLTLRTQAGRTRPYLVVEFTRARENEADLEPFYERWHERADEVVIRDYDPCCGERADLSPMHLFPPRRSLCRRLTSKLTIRSDGAVVLCDEDRHARSVLGHAGRESLDSIWNGAALQAVRAAHLEGRYDANPLCGACTVWHTA